MYITICNVFPPFFRPYEIMSHDIKKAFTSCIPCMKLKVPTDSDEIDKKTLAKMRKNAARDADII